MGQSYKHILTITFILSTFFAAFSSRAQDAASPQSYGLAMHGQSKYSAEDIALDYAYPNAPKGGKLKMAAIGSFDTFNPYSIKGTAPENINLIYDRLMRRVWDEPFTMYPLIAQRAITSEDRSEVTFHLNPKARFHDGSPITAQDVMFSYETLRDYGRPNMQRIYKIVQDAHIIDEHTIHFKFGEGYDRETVMIFALMPVLSKSWWSEKDFSAGITQLPLANGPYQIKEASLGKSITYERVPDYWAQDLLVNKGHHNFDTIELEYFRDDTIALEAFKKGDLSVRREWDTTKWYSAYGDLSDSLIKEEVKHGRPAPAHGFIFNTRKDIFKDQRVRKALILAFDAQWIAQNIYHDRFKQIDSVFANSILSAAEGLNEEEKKLLEPWADDIAPIVYEHPQYDARHRLRFADKLLKDAGWNVIKNVRTHSQSATPLSFELIVATPQEEKIALSYQTNLRRLGVNMSIRQLDSATFQQRKNTYSYDMIAESWRNSLSPGTEQYLMWSCASALQEGRFNYSGICTPALDHFTQKIADAKDYDSLMENAHIIDTLVMGADLMVPLFYNSYDYVAHSQDIMHPEKSPIYGIVIETWWHTNTSE